MSPFAARPADRMALPVAERNFKMAVSAHADVRGSTEKFYEWLEGSKRALMPEGPSVWICGDCHVGNLGPVASARGKVAIQVRDLDQTVIGNPALDLMRLALSLAMAARGSDLPDVTTAHMLERMIVGYESAFSPEAQGETTDAVAEMPQIVASVMREAAGRSWRHLADERIEGVEPTIPLGKRFWPLTQEERSAVKELFAQENLRRLVTSPRSRKNEAHVRVDAAYGRKIVVPSGGFDWLSWFRSIKGAQTALSHGCEGRNRPDSPSRFVCTNAQQQCRTRHRRRE
jgi:uncharacterized protein (DUF2252 family)